MIQDEIRRRLQSALALREFPPTITCPESTRETSPASLFAVPFLVWVPESREANWTCPVEGCSCTPQVRGYQARTLDDVEHCTHILFCRYRCRTARKMFSTLSKSFMDAQPQEVSLQFPYVMTHNYGISKKLMQVIHAGVTSRQGMKSAMDGVTSQRQTRFYNLRSLLADRVCQSRAKNPSYIAPAPPTLEQYSVEHKLSDQDTLARLWLWWSDVYSALCEMVMNTIEVKKLVRIDHSRKFTSLIKNTGDKGEKEGITNFHLLLLVQNERGQIVARALTASENNTETESVLREKILPRIPDTPSEDYYLVTDNVNAVRGSVERIFGDRVKTKQDPLQVIQGFTKKVRRGLARSRVAKALSACVYSADNQLRNPTTMATLVRQLGESVRSKDVVVAREEWQGTLRSNLLQIERGDLAVPDNFYREHGCSSKVVSTSQLEGVHSQVKRCLSHPVSLGVGLRVLDIFILEHNLRVGARWGRNPSLEQSDFLQLCQSALLCNGSVPESPLYEFALNVLSRPIAEPRYRLTSAYDFPFRRWMGIFNAAQPSPERIILQAHARSKHDIQDLMFHNAANVKIKDLPRSKLMDSLYIVAGEMEVGGPLTSAEIELSKQIRREMSAFKDGLSGLDEELDWTSCGVTTTVLYNLAVSANEKRSVPITRRSYSALHKIIGTLDELIAVKHQSSKPKIPLFKFATPRVADNEHKAHEQAVQTDLFKVLKHMPDVTHRKRVFARVYTMASCMSENLCAKSFNVLYTRWETLNTYLRRQRIREQEEKTNAVTDPVVAIASVEVQAPRPGMAPTISIAPEAVPVTALFTASVAEAQLAAVPSPVLSDVVQLPLESRLPAVPTDTAVRQEHSLTNASTSGAFTRIREEDLQRLLDEASAIGRAPGKWEHIYGIFKSLYPSSSLSVNALQCRLKVFKARLARTSSPSPPVPSARHSVSQQASTGSKRKHPSPACTSCASRRKNVLETATALG